MANVNDLFYHGIRHQVRRVLVAMGPERVEKGLTAFDDGAPTWNNCFFARAYSDYDLLEGGDPEQRVCELIGIKSAVPVRIVYHLFDDWKDNHMTKEQLRAMMEEFMDEVRPVSPEVRELLNSVTLRDINTPIEMQCA